MFCLFCSLSKYERRDEFDGSSDKVWKLKPRFAYKTLFFTDKFNQDALMVECRGLLYNLLWYTISYSYCPKLVVDFDNRVVCDVPTGQMTVNYG